MLALGLLRCLLDELAACLVVLLAARALLLHLGLVDLGGHLLNGFLRVIIQVHLLERGQLPCRCHIRLALQLRFASVVERSLPHGVRRVRLPQRVALTARA